MKTTISRATCKDCGQEFEYPNVPDMDWTLFFYSEQGSVLGFYEPLLHPLWDNVKQTLIKNTPDSLDLSHDNDPNVGSRLQWVIASCADKIDNLRLTSEFACRQCHSSNLILFDEAMEVRNIPQVSFKEFESLNEDNKVKKALNFTKRV